MIKWSLCVSHRRRYNDHKPCPECTASALWGARAINYDLDRRIDAIREAADDLERSSIALLGATDGDVVPARIGALVGAIRECVIEIQRATAAEWQPHVRLSHTRVLRAIVLGTDGRRGPKELEPVNPR
jgi:hypothetical protein